MESPTRMENTETQAKRSGEAPERSRKVFNSKRPAVPHAAIGSGPGAAGSLRRGFKQAPGFGWDASLRMLARACKAGRRTSFSGYRAGCPSAGS